MQEAISSIALPTTLASSESGSGSSMDTNSQQQNSNFLSAFHCQICLQPFHFKKRTPKVLPCGHNFCKHCILSLCYHQQYYLLDSIDCPTCRTKFSTSIAISAPNNHILCQRLKENQLKKKENISDTNITVIHVADSNPVITNRCSESRSTFCYSQEAKVCGKSKLLLCFDCLQTLDIKKYKKEARFCEKCFSSKNNDDTLQIICLECCVNRHNGHDLVTLSEIENEQVKLIKNLHNLQQSIKEIGIWIESSLRILKEHTILPTNEYNALCSTKKNLEKECAADMRFALSVLENCGQIPLPPGALERMRQHQYHNFAKLHKLLHFIEIFDSDELIVSINLLSVLSSTSINHSSAHQTRTSFLNNPSDVRSATEAISTVLTVACSREFRSRNKQKIEMVENTLKMMQKNSTKVDQRVAMLSCAKQLREFIDETCSKQSMLLFIDAYLHIFYHLNYLVTRFSSTENDRNLAEITRWNIWKLVQLVYSDLMRSAAKHWQSIESERVDLVDDLSFLCSLYSDVSDEATITICMIEAARARAAVAAAAAADSINLIDEHLLECRRVQKLQQLRESTSQKPRKYISAQWQSMKYMRKLLLACFFKSSSLHH
ncbi:unnamed protein product [Thelazia callipaeda]|uniref:RING-type domain-containing protein n=1 Tax=Thelazia callipaeda TaxID=103827 RepID=A0A0N5CU14_THECL|nr:unnamed protein product [Thelazia callipaeda]